MARMSQLLSAVCLGIAVTAAVGAVTAAVEYAPVHRSPAHLAESTSHARVIVKFKSGASVLSTRSSIQSAAAAAAAGGRIAVQAASVLGGRLGVALTDGRALGERTQVMMASGMTSSALARTIAADSDVEWAQVDHRRFVQSTPVSDPLYPGNLNNLSTGSGAQSGPVAGQWYLRAPGFDASGHNLVSAINIEPAWAITHGSSAIVIGDVDTGISAHPDLSVKIFAATFSGTTSSTPYGYDFVGYGENNSTDSADALATANDGDLADPDPSDPGDWVTAAENSQVVNGTPGPFFGCIDNGTGAAVPANSSWHGTQTGGILAAATNNGIGMAGTGYNAMLVPARALGKCGGYDSDIIAAAEWVGGVAVSGVPTNIHPARVINMSLGGSGTCATDAPAYVDALTALRNLGVIVVAAAGNDKGLPVDIPANCQPATTDSDQTPIVVAVAGLRHAGDKVGYSDIGPEITIAAPAGNCVNTAANSQCLYPILTTANSGTTSPVVGGGIYTDGLQSPSLGTSFATPLVAGTVALMLSANPGLTNSEVVHTLKNTATTFPTVSDTLPNPAACTVPVAEVKDSNGNVTTPASAAQDECICTTSTCGAGMLNAGSAVATAQALLTATAPVAAISPTSPTVLSGGTVTLSGTGSALSSTGAALNYQWSIADGSGAIALSTTTGSSVVVTGVAAGSGQVQLTVTDANGMMATSATAVTVNAPSSSSSGGGAASPAWLFALIGAGLLLGNRTRRARP